MIIGLHKDKVINNIKNNIKNNELNKKVEVDDPNLSDEELYKLIKRFYDVRKNKLAFYIKNKIANKFIDKLNNDLNKNLKIVGIETIKKIKTGAIITNNHFNPLDSLPIRKMVKSINRNLYIVTDAANLALPGKLSFIINHLQSIPLKRTPSYINRTFKPNNFVLIYPEEEMWFNYKKPRPCKRGSYEFAALCNVPIVPCFTEMVVLDTDDNDEFKLVEYVLHILKPIYPDPNKSVRSNSIEMAELDYKQKVEAYEKIYNTKLDYKFSYKDIAGYKKKD